jgi:hypothetical protein
MQNISFTRSPYPRFEPRQQLVANRKRARCWLRQASRPQVQCPARRSGAIFIGGAKQLPLSLRLH